MSGRSSGGEGGPALLAAVKRAATADDPTLALPAGSPVHSLLRPVPTTPGALDAGDVRRLSDWRNLHSHAFLSEFRATPERTARWLAEVVGPADDRVAFMVDDLTRRSYAAIGLAHIDWAARSCELDGVMRGEAAPARHAMADAVTALLGWANRALGVHECTVRVRAENAAVGFYAELGFEPVRRAGLRRVIAGDEARWEEVPGGQDAAAELLHMRRLCSARRRV